MIVTNSLQVAQQQQPTATALRVGFGGQIPGAV